MKRLIFLLTTVLFTLTAYAQVAINTDGSSPGTSAMLDIKSDTAGLLVTDNDAFYYYNNSSWQEVGNSSSAWVVSGSTISADSTKHIVIGDNSGSGTFQVITDQSTGGYSFDQCSGGTASASQCYSGKPASNAFDNANATYWSNDNTLPVSLQYDFGSGNKKKITLYRIYFESNYDVSPEAWQFQGSDDASTWTTLDSQSSQGWNASEWKEYYVGNTSHYRYYRLNIIDNKGSGDNYVSVYEMEMLETEYVDYPALFVDNNKVGIGTSFPQATFEVNGKIRISDDLHTVEAGEIRWNAGTQDFEGYNGNRWMSFTRQKSGWANNNGLHESTSVINIDSTQNDLFGCSICIDGNNAIVGAYNKTIGSNQSQGAVFIFQNNGTAWVKKVQLSPPNPASYDYFGNSVYINGDYAIVGAEFKTYDNNNSGMAFIYHYNNSSWILQAQLTSTSSNSYAFGSSVAINGDYAIIGDDSEKIQNNNFQGAAYIFHRTDTIWSEQARLIASDGNNLDFFGSSVSIDGDYAVIGAYEKEIGYNTCQGEAYIFHRSGTSWAEQKIIVLPDGGSYDRFGYSVSISGEYVLIGASIKDVGTNNNQGKAYIYLRSGTNWTQQATLISSDGCADDHFGESVSIDGVYAVIGANNKEIGDNGYQGKAYVFCRVGTTWSEQAQLSASDGALQDYFGSCASISENHIIVGAPNKNIGNNTNQGKVYFFPRN